MDRYIDAVMVCSERIDERARLIARLHDTIAPLVGDLGPDTPAVVRGAMLAAVNAGHECPLDLVADVIDRLSNAVDVAPTWRTLRLGPGATLALGVCDGLGVSDTALAAVLGIERDDVVRARDVARQEVGLPPAPSPCRQRHPFGITSCVTCVLVRADARTAQATVQCLRSLPHGVVVDRVVEHAIAWEAAHLAAASHDEPASESGPSPWSAVVMDEAAV